MQLHILWFSAKRSLLEECVQVREWEDDRAECVCGFRPTRTVIIHKWRQSGWVHWSSTRWLSLPPSVSLRPILLQSFSFICGPHWNPVKTAVSSIPSRIFSMLCVFSILLPPSKHVRLTDYVVTKMLVCVCLCLCVVAVQSVDLPLPHVVGDQHLPWASSWERASF